MDGNFIRKKIENTGFQLIEVAKKLDISPQDLQSKLRSKDVKVSFLENVARAINKNVYYFFEDDNKTKSEENTNLKNVSENVSKNVSKPNVKKEASMVMEEAVVYTVDKGNLRSVSRIPLIPVEAMAGFGSGSVQVMDYDTETYNVPEFTELNVDFMIKVKGSSMYPKYSSGDLVACKKLFIADIFFQWNKVYVLDTEQGALIKRIKKSLKEECVTLLSENPSYDPFELHLSKIYAVALVVGVIRLE